MKKQVMFGRSNKARRPIALIVAVMMLVMLIPFTLIAITGYFADAETIGVDNSGRINIADALAQGEVRTGKTVTAVDGQPGVFEISLQAIGRSFELEEERQVPVQYDVVFVLDYSASMNSPASKLRDMKDAAVSAINQIVANNTSTYYNRVAVVGYHSSASTVLNWKSNSTPITASTLDKATDSRTNTMTGMYQAYNLLNTRTGDFASRPAIIILMSDGQPNGYYSNWNSSTLAFSGSVTNVSSGQDANAASVSTTIKYIKAVKDAMAGSITVAGESFPKLEIFSVGFDIDGFSAQQTAYAYAVLNPSAENIANTPSGVATGLGLGSATYSGIRTTYTEWQATWRTQTRATAGSTNWTGASSWSAYTTTRQTVPDHKTNLTTTIRTNVSTQENSSVGNWSNASMSQYLFYADASLSQTVNENEALVRMQIQNYNGGGGGDQGNGNGNTRPQSRTVTIVTDPDGNGTSLMMNPASNNWVNPVDKFITADINAIERAFVTIIESITYNDPLNGDMTIVDKIDDRYEIVDRTVLPGSVTENNGLLTWTFSNLERLPASGDGVIGDHQLSDLTFRVQLKEASLSEQYRGQTLYTNTEYYNQANNPNYAVFAPLSNNPHYFSANGSILREVDRNTGKVTHPLTSSGWVDVAWAPDVPSISITKEIDNQAIDPIYPVAEYTLTIENDGDHDLINVKVTDTLSSAAASIEITSVVMSGAPLDEGADYSLEISQDRMGFELTFFKFIDTNPLKPGETIIIDYTVEYAQIINGAASTDRGNSAVVSAKSNFNDATVTDGDDVDAKQEGKTKSAAISKSVYSINGLPVLGAADNIVEKGDIIIYSVTVTNTGDLPLSLLNIVDNLQGAVRCDENGCTANLDPIGGALQDSLTVYFKYIVPDDVGNGSIVNTATASFEDIDDIDDSETVYTAAPIITVVKELTNTPASVTGGGLALFSHGDSLFFQITIANEGDADANATLSDYLSRADGVSFNPAIDMRMLDANGKEIAVPNPLTVPANTSVTVFYEVEAVGQSDSGWQDAMDDAIRDLEDAYEGYQAAIDETQEAVNNAEQNVLLALEALAAAEQELNDALAEYNVDAAPVFEYEQIEILDDDGEVIGYEDGEITDMIYPDASDFSAERLELAQEAYADAQEALAAAQSALAAAQEALDDLIINGAGGMAADAEAVLDSLKNSGPTGIIEYANYAAYGDYAPDSVSFAVDYEKLPFITLNKEVRVGSGSPSKFAVANDGDLVEFIITITNIGSDASEPMLLRDDFEGFRYEEDIPSIPAGGQHIVRLNSSDNDWGGVLYNSSYTLTKLATNTATLIVDDEVAASSSASVVIPPLPAAILSINKEVRASGTGDEFAKSAIVNSNDAVTFDFRITLTNSGNADAVVNVADYFRGDTLINETVTVPAGWSEVFNVSATIGADESDINVAAYSAGGDNAINPDGSSSAFVKVNSLPYAELSVEKKVYAGNNTWSDETEFYVSAGQTQDAIFRITVANGGNATGRFTLTDAFDGTAINVNDLYLSPYFLDGDKLVGSSFYNSADGCIMVRADDSLDLYYKAEALAPRGAAYINEVAISPVRAAQSGAWAISDTIRAPGSGRADYSSDSAKVTIIPKTAINVTLSIDKKVAIAGTVNDPSTIGTWADDISITASGSVDVFYRITVTKGGNADYTVRGNINDLLNNAPFSLTAGQASFEIGAGETTWVTYVRATLTGAGTHSNVASIAGEEIDFGSDSSTRDISLIVSPRSSTATVAITAPAGNGGNGGDGGTSYPPPTSPYIPAPTTPTTPTADADDNDPDPGDDGLIIINDSYVPLGAWDMLEDEAEDEEELWIVDSEVPLADFPVSEMPQTGIESNLALWIFALCASLLGAASLAAAIVKANKKSR